LLSGTIGQEYFGLSFFMTNGSFQVTYLPTYPMIVLSDGTNQLVPVDVEILHEDSEVSVD